MKRGAQNSQAPCFNLTTVVAGLVVYWIYLVFTFMGSFSPSVSINAPPEGSNSDEVFLQHSLLFAESLKDLKNIRAQLHSAAEYFESSYMRNEHKQLVEDTLKDYITRAIINTVDHLGSVASKVSSFLDDKSNEISAATLRFSSIEQRVRTFQEIIGRSGLLEQSLIIETPKHYKRYTIPVYDGQTMSKLRSIIPNGCILSPQNDTHQNKQPDDLFSKAFQGNVTKPHPPLLRRGTYMSNSTELHMKPQTFSFMRLASRKEGEKRAVSPISFSLGRSGSVANRSISPGSCSNKKRCPSEPRRSSMMFMNPERNKGKEVEMSSRKSKHLFKALLSIHRSRKEGVPHKFRDDY